jgi:hypothetical protein
MVVRQGLAPRVRGKKRSRYRDIGHRLSAGNGRRHAVTPSRPRPELLPPVVARHSGCRKTRVMRRMPVDEAWWQRSRGKPGLEIAMGDLDLHRGLAGAPGE